MMSPIEKVWARAAAMEELGVDPGAGPEEIRDAWRRTAFEAHPDHGGGGGDDFARAKAAYDVLRDAGRAGPDQTAAESRGPSPRRPRIVSREVFFSQEEQAACQTLLDANLVNADNIVFIDPAGVQKGGKAASSPWNGPKDHVAVSLCCQGRQLTYNVDATVKAGINRVALPVTVPGSTQPAKPTIVEFRCAKAGTGEVTVPERLQAKLFPGTRRVAIRFHGESAEA